MSKEYTTIRELKTKIEELELKVARQESIIKEYSQDFDALANAIGPCAKILFTVDIPTDSSDDDSGSVIDLTGEMGPMDTD